MRKLKVGIIGLGRIGSLYDNDGKARKYYKYLTHAGSYAKHPDVKIVCGTDVDTGRREKFAKMRGVDRLYSDYNKMLRENRLDILSICTNPDMHYEIIKRASRHVKVIFCEKPFTRSSAEIKKIIRLKNDTGLKIAINLYRQFDPSHRNVGTMIKNRKFGNVQRVNCYYGEGLRNMGSHLLGYIVSIFGYPEKMVVLAKKKDIRLKEYSYDVYFEFNNKMPVIVQACDFNSYRLFEIDFICEKGRVQILHEGLAINSFSVCSNKAESGARQLTEKRRFMNSSVGAALYYAVDNLVKLCRYKSARPVVSAEDYLRLQLLIEKIEREGEKL